MAWLQSTHLARRRLVIGAAAFFWCLRGTTARATESAIYTLDVSDVSAKVGESAVLIARVRLHDGYRILHAYNNRIGQLSAFDNAVEFERKAFPGTDQEGVLVFAVNLRPTKPGKHPINGVVRFDYLQGSEEMAMISVPVIANVVGET